MVLLGGLELVAVGYLLNEFNQDKVEEREKRKHGHRPSSSRPSSSRPSSTRPPTSRPSAGSQSLMPPVQSPPRPSSAPPGPNGIWQNQTPPYAQTPPNPVSRPQGSQQPFPQMYHQPPPPGPYQQPPTAIPPHMNQGPPRLQHPNSFPMQPRPSMGASNYPPPQPTVKPPSGPLVYVDTKTGKIQHNMYPPDHPMARGLESTRDDSALSGNVYDHPQYAGSQPAELDGTFTRRGREDELAYGKDYTRRSRSSTFR